METQIRLVVFDLLHGNNGAGEFLCYGQWIASDIILSI